MSNLAAEWLEAKEAERAAMQHRRDIEDRMVERMGVMESLTGTMTGELEGYKVKVTGRMNRTISGEALQEIAAENGLTDHLGSLFRWKPEINAKAWADADAEITGLLVGAITTKPGRPSFSIDSMTAETDTTTAPTKTKNEAK